MKNVKAAEVEAYTTGFETSEGFTVSTSYNNTTEVAFGPTGKQWMTYYGTASTTSPITGSNSMQMRWYTGSAANLGYARMDFDIAKVTTVTFKAKNTNGLNVSVSHSTDSGATWSTGTVYTLSTSAATYTYTVSETGEYENVRVKFTIALPDTAPTGTSRLIIDDVVINSYVDTSSTETLATPVASMEGKTVSWAAVENASGYKVGFYSDTEGETALLEKETTETSYTFEDLPYGTSYVKVVALGDNTNYLNSEASESIVVEKNEVYVVTIAQFLALAVNEYTTLQKYQVTGTLKAFYTSNAESTTNNYSSSYNNASFYLTDGTNSIIAYRVVGEEGANLAVGDVVTVKGVISSFNSVNQIASGGSYVEITPAAIAQFTALETKTSLKLTIENEEVSAVAIRFGMMMTVAQYEALVALDATFGVAVVKKATLGENDLAEVVDEYAFACATVVRVNANGEADEAGEYYQFAFVVNNVPSTDYAVELVAACYVLVNGEYFVAAEAVQSVQSVAQAYVNADDTSAYANYLAYLNELAGN